MDLDENKEVCATCEDWQGKREWLESGKVCRVSSTARGQCARLKKVKLAQGGCSDWKKYEAPKA